MMIHLTRYTICLCLVLVIAFTGVGQAKDIDVLLYSPESSDSGMDMVAAADFLNKMLHQTEGYHGSSCVAYSQSGVGSLVEGYHDPTYQANTLTQVEGDYDFVILLPNSWFVRRYPEMTFEGVYQLSRHILNAGAQPVLLMGDAKNTAEVNQVGENVYRVANGCGIMANPSGYAIQEQGLVSASTTEDRDRQAYLVAASLYAQLTGLSAAHLSYDPVANSSALAQSAYEVVQAHEGLSHYNTSRHNSGIIRYRYLDLSAEPISSMARYCYKGTSTENGISNHLKPILQANGYIAESKLVSSNADGTKEWRDADFDLVKPHFDTRQDKMFLAYARGSQSGSAQMVNYNQANLMTLTFDRHYDSIGTGLASTQNMLNDMHARNWSMFLDHYYYQWNTVPYHIAAARFYQADSTVVASTDGVHATTPFNNLIASMMLASSLGQDLNPSVTIQNNSQSLLAFNIGKQLVKQLAYLSEDEGYVPDSQLVIDNTALPIAITTVVYNHSLAATGGAAPFVWEDVSQGGLPTGLSLSLSGELSGTVSDEVGIHQLVFKVTDAHGCIRKLPFKLLVQDRDDPSYDHWSEWIFDNSGVPAVDRLPSEDPDGDGASNFLEHAVRTNPVMLDSSQGVQWDIDPEGGKVAVSFVRGLGGVRYRLESTDDLADWNDAGILWDSQIHVLDLVEVGELQGIQLVLGDDDRRFYRVAVSRE